MQGKTLLAWERQDGEDEDAWQAFRSFRDQSPPRRPQHAAVRRSDMIMHWFNTFAWAERVAAYDRHLDALRRKSREELLAEGEKERAARQLGQIKAVQDVLDRELAKLARDTAESEAFGLVKVSDLNKLLANSITLERLIRGQSTENVAVDVDLDNLTPDELREMRKLQQKLSGKKEGDE